MVVEISSECPEIFQLLTPRSLKALLSEPKERSVPSPINEFKDGKLLSTHYYSQLDPKTMTCVPLEEIDSAYINIKTFVVIGKFGTIHRYTAKNSLAVLSPLNPVRRWSIYITTHWLFALFMTIVVILNTISSLNNMGKFYDYSATIIYTLEFLLKIISEGLVRDPFSYLRKPLNWLDLTVILTSLILPLKNVSVLYWTRVLKIIPLCSDIRRSFNLIKTSMFKLRPSMLFALMVIFILAVLGKLGFHGVFSPRCVNHTRYFEQLSTFGITNETEAGQVMSWEDFAKLDTNWHSDNLCAIEDDQQFMECPGDDYECVFGIATSPDYGLTSFDSIKFAVIQTVRIIDQDYMTKILTQLTDATASPNLTILYFVILFFFGTYAIGTIAYSIMANFIFKTMEEQNINIKNTSKEGQAKTVYKKPAKTDRVQYFIYSVLNSVLFEVFITSTILVDAFALSLGQHNMSSFASSFVKWATRVVIAIYSVEFVLKIILEGPKKYFKKGWSVFDFVILCDLYLKSWYKKYLLNIPFRLFKITLRWNTLNLTFKVALNCIKYLRGMGGLLFTFGVYMSLVGMSEFRDNYLSNKHLFENGILPRWSFVDFMHSAMIVFRSWIGESIEVLGDCLLVAGGANCFIYFSVVALSGCFILMALTIGVIFVTDKTLKSEGIQEHSILSKMFCLPYVWMKNYAEEKESLNQQRTQVPKVVFCSPPMGGSKVLGGVTTFIIIVFSIVLVLDDIPNENDIDIKSVVYAVDVVFTVFITIMSGYGLVVLGVKYCVTSPGWIFDVFVILEMILNLLYDLKPDMYPYPMFYLFRSMRPFMLCRRFETLEIVLRGLLKELRNLWKFIVVGLFLWLYFAIFGTKLFSGSFSKCLEEEGGSLINSSLVLDKKQCLALNHTWENSDLNFDHIGKSFVSLSLVGKRNSWVTILYDSVDFHSPQMNFTREYNLNKFYFFLAFFVCGIFFVVNIVFGVIYYNLNKFLGIFLTSQQFTLYKNSSQTLDPKKTVLYLTPNGKYREQAIKVVSSDYFDVFVMLIILIDIILYAFIDFNSELLGQEPSIIHSLRHFILFLYSLEMLLKLFGWGKRYFFNGWNQFDFFLIVIELIALMWQFIKTFLILNSSGLVLRFALASWKFDTNILRILRVLRIFQCKMFMKKAKIIRIYFKSFSRFSGVFRNIMIFQSVLMYTYCLVGIRKFGHVKLIKGLDNHFNFKTVDSSMRILFMLSSMAGVDGILPALTEESDCTPDHFEEGGKIYQLGDCGSLFWGTLFVFSYSFFSFLIVTNLYLLFILEIVKNIQFSFTKSDKIVIVKRKIENNRVNPGTSSGISNPSEIMSNSIHNA